MGLLALGTPLTWSEAQKYADHVRWHGITQFMHTWDRLKDRSGDELLWGDEIEYMVVIFDNENKNVKLSLRQTEILLKLGSITAELMENPSKGFTIPTFHPEYGRFMLESTPGSPYTGYITDLLSVEANMRFRRNLIRKYLNSNELPMTMTTFPRLGTPGSFTEPYYDPSGALASHSLFLPDEITNPHIRFPTLTANIRERRGSKVAINLPIFFDTHTPRPFIDPSIPWDRHTFPEDQEAKDFAAKQDHIYLDAMGFGMGSSCLQLTFQGCNLSDAKRLYDAFIPIGPILLALTAASPIWRGWLSDVDCRWNVIAGSVDDRTEEERGLKPLKNNKFVIPKSRYDSVDMYISDNWYNRPEYNDSGAPFDAEIYERLRRHGIDDLLSKHLSHLFIRDPLVIFRETIDQDDTTSTDHFENLQSTNWQTVRFKPPPPKSPIGWRVEFRSMEVMMTDFENAAFSVFLVLLSRAILSFKLNLYVPISKVDENMQRAQRRNAAVDTKFIFRKHILPPGHHSPTASGTVTPCNTCGPESVIKGDPKMDNCFEPITEPVSAKRVKIEDEYEDMTMNEIMNGKNGDFPGLLGVVYAYLETLDVTPKKREKILQYLNLLKLRANGSLQTPATWIRNFVRSHAGYKHDSAVNDEVIYDLMVAVDQIERGVRKEPSLLPTDYMCPVDEPVPGTKN